MGGSLKLSPLLWATLLTICNAQEAGQPIQGQTNTAMVTATSTSFFSTIQTNTGDTTNSAAGAAGEDTGSFGTLSKGGLIAIIVVVSVVVVFGSELSTAATQLCPN